MISPFVVGEHTFDGQHIREYPRALAESQEDTIRLHAKSYTPVEVSNGQATGDLTIVAFHANAFQKEVYEPFFEALYLKLRDHHNLLVNSIWIADQAAQGRSALLNDEILGNDPSWFDHSRDVLNMVNTFRKQMRRPIIAIGHSMGGTQALATAHLHPRLFEAMIMIDPAIATSPSPSLHAIMQFALSRPDRYESREEAEKFVRRNPMFKFWEPRVVQRYIDTGFHTSSTKLNHDASVKPATAPHVEIASAVRLNPDHVGRSGTSILSDVQHALHPNLDPKSPLVGPVYNPHSRIAWSQLPSLRPPALFLLGKGSKMCPVDQIQERTNITGAGTGGSGGVATGKVASVTIPGGHFLPMTNVQGTADAAAVWLAVQIKRFRETEAQIMQSWERKATAEKQKLEPKTVDLLKTWNGKPWTSQQQVEKSRL